MKSLLLFLLLTMSTVSVLEGSYCEKSGIGKLSCNPCGKGSRCLFCSWCTGFCFNGQSRVKRDAGGIEYGSVEALYKTPFLDLFSDLETLLRSNGISDLDVVALYKSVTVVTKEDCEICNNSTEINNLHIFADKVRVELEYYVGTILFKQQAKQRTAETRNMVQNLPDSLKIKVESNSNILKSFKGI